MVKAVFDTNILIDYLHGVTPARTEFERYEQVFISTGDVDGSGDWRPGRRGGHDGALPGHVGSDPCG